MKTLGEKIKELRKNAGISQEKLSFEIDVSRQTICNWEADITAPNAQCLERIGKYFQIDAAYFFDSEVVKDENATSEDLSENRNDFSTILKRLKISSAVFGV